MKPGKARSFTLYSGMQRHCGGGRSVSNRIVDAFTFRQDCRAASRRSDILKPRIWIVSGTVTLVLAAAVALQFGYRLREQPSTNLAVPLTRVLPQALEGWVVSEEKLGATESGTAGALRQLNVEDYVYRRYERQRKAFTIYAAHWPPGRMPTRLVASHTPDRCWTENGMRCIDMRFRERYRIGSLALAPAESRVFQWPDGSQRSHVVYWHMVENKAYDYGSRFNAAPHPWLWWKDTVAQAVYGSREQLFVRIVSEVPMAEWWREPGFVAVLSSVKGIFEER